MQEVINFMEVLIKEMDCTGRWYVIGIEEFKEVTENDEVYAKISDGSKFKKYGDIYIHQTDGYCGDDFSGTIIRPITERNALVIGYEC
ncbi:hypothetical protein OWO94_13140 [Bacillus paranthracis]|uniref:hypothetical protein n=1 Tax=Bacillus cereus group TaxID=86661 RepID=UPI0022E662BA|nr:MULTISPECIES: hypothetical protein [Bacillus cereus group]MDA1747710.1 hypothetical protein [Bacillus cereus group sp. LD121LC]MDK7537845.1 hypothetical protein [Bacillus paranthracis]MDK7560949.1 hypothetical protein [Bacillus paranthracis]